MKTKNVILLKAYLQINFERKRTFSIHFELYQQRKN